MPESFTFLDTLLTNLSVTLPAEIQMSCVVCWLACSGGLLGGLHAPRQLCKWPGFEPGPVNSWRKNCNDKATTVGRANKFLVTNLDHTGQQHLATE